MELSSAPQKKSKLTLYIIIALFAGIILGFSLNKSYLAEENSRLETVDVRIKTIKAEQHHTNRQCPYSGIHH
jgi:L-cystine uptake protein TcyP (sodium:dicarboxylate symporter family)